VLNVADFCNECGNCTTFCPTKGSPFSDKPRFCLTEKSFNQTENGFFIQKDADGTTLLHRNGESVMKLTKAADLYEFSNNEINVKFDLIDFHIISAEKKGYLNTEIILNKAAEMKVLIDSVNEFNKIEITI